MKIEKILYEKETLTIEQLKELEEAKKYPIIYDEDSPELTPEMEKSFLLAAVSRNRSKDVENTKKLKILCGSTVTENENKETINKIL